MCGRALSCWKTKQLFLRMNGTTTGHKMSPQYRCAFSVCLNTIKLVFPAQWTPPHTIKLLPSKRLTEIAQAFAQLSPGRLQTLTLPSANFSVNRDSSKETTVLKFRRMYWFSHACHALLWWTVNSIPLCRLLDLKRQVLSVLRTVCTGIRTPVALRTLSTILVAGKKSRPAVILMLRSSLWVGRFGVPYLGLS